VNRALRCLAVGVVTACLAGHVAPLRAQSSAPRPTPREGPDTTCGPSYGSKPFGDSLRVKTADSGRIVRLGERPDCPAVGEAASTRSVPGADRATPGQVAPVSAKADSLRRQVDSSSRRPQP
jgi:hypothetical protein